MSVQIALTHYTGKRATLVFDPEQVNWTKQKRCKHSPYNGTGLQPPFGQVFIKRWEERRAPAHSLLEQARGHDLPGTAKILGLGQEGEDWFYVYEFLPFKVLDELLRSQREYTI